MTTSGRKVEKKKKDGLISESFGKINKNIHLVRLSIKSPIQNHLYQYYFEIQFFRVEWKFPKNERQHRVTSLREDQQWN